MGGFENLAATFSVALKQIEKSLNPLTFWGDVISQIDEVQIVEEELCYNYVTPNQSKPIEKLNLWQEIFVARVNFLSN